MLFPARGIEIIRALYTASPQDDEARRKDIQKVGEQLCHDLGNTWGNKKRSGLSDNFRSPDSIAYHEDDGTVSVWDIQSSTGAILVSAGDPPTHPNLSPSEADFMACQPVDHMGDGQEQLEPEPEPDDLSPRVAALEAQVEVLTAEIGAQDSEIDALHSRLAALEQHALRDTDVLKVVGRTESSAFHQHAVNLQVRKG